MRYQFRPSGVCSQNISFDIEDGKVKNIEFLGGCNGNLQGISRLAEGRSADEVIGLLQGVSCGGRPTSCPDQFSKALTLALEKEAQK